MPVICAMLEFEDPWHTVIFVIISKGNPTGQLQSDGTT